MGNALYDKAREKFLIAELNWETMNIRAVLVNLQAHTPNTTLHEFLSDVSSGARVATSPVFDDKTTTGGAADAADITFSAVSGSSVGAIILYVDNGDPANSDLIAVIDTATGLPITPNGGDIIVTWDNGVNKIFRL